MIVAIDTTLNEIFKKFDCLFYWLGNQVIAYFFIRQQ